MKSTGGNSTFKGYAGKARAKSQRKLTDRCYACGNGYAGKAGASGERIVADRLYAVGERYAGKVVAIDKRKVGDSGKLASFRKSYSGKGGIVVAWRCSAECVLALGMGCVIKVQADYRYGQVWAVRIGTVIGGYNYVSGCRTITGAFIGDAVAGVGTAIIDCRKIKPCRAGGVFA